MSPKLVYRGSGLKQIQHLCDVENSITSTAWMSSELIYTLKTKAKMEAEDIDAADQVHLARMLNLCFSCQRIYWNLRGKKTLTNTFTDNKYPEI